MRKGKKENENILKKMVLERNQFMLTWIETEAKINLQLRFSLN